jgi:hypothetical protein
MVNAKHRCRYSIIRFMPHVETGEFANIGIVLVAPSAGFFNFRVEVRRYARITNFFDTLEPEFFRNAAGALVCELERVREMLPSGDSARLRLNVGFEQTFTHLFDELTRARGGVITFSDSRVVASDDPATTLHKLFGHYVERNFVTPQYREAVLEQHMKSWFQEHDLGNRFVKRQFDDGVYRASFPFVEVDQEGEARKIIKPFFLGQKEPTYIIDHGVKWATTVRRLRKARVIPKRVLFAVEGPAAGGAHIAAYEETRDLLRDSDIDVIPFDRQQAILDYAVS